MTYSDFDAFASQAEPGTRPYPYQARIAESGIPEVLHAPTGSGKTMAGILPWLYRRLFYADAEVRHETPRWLVFALPMRVLVEQTFRVVETWLNRLELRERVGLYPVMGGEPLSANDWRLQPEREAIFIGTLDMLLSRALNRGYAAGRFSWPIDFALFNNDCQWVFDEIQLMGPALPTSRQLEGLRRKLGTFRPSSTMWMSATIERRWLETFDLPDIGDELSLGPDDRTPELAKRLDAAKTIERLEIDASSDPGLARAIVDRHKPGTRSIAVFNTVRRAQAIYAEVERLNTAAEVVLLHSRFRPPERRARTDEALAEIDPGGPGRILVSTQVIEAGVDISSATLFTEAAPWPSIVQRAGRCNRYGELEDASVYWASAPKVVPYDEDDVEAATEALAKLEGGTVTPESLSGMQVRSRDLVYPVLRRRDLIGLFDTASDLSGNDIDVSRLIREDDEIDVYVAWREVDPSASGDAPTREELCPVPVGDVRDLLRKKGRPPALHYDHIAERWRRLDTDEVRPGIVVVLRTQDGRYDPRRGWEPSHPEAVQPVSGDAPHPLASADEGVADDPLSVATAPVTLLQHLMNVETAAREVIDAFGPSLPASLKEAIVVAARMHDIGKAHPAFQGAVSAMWADDEREERMASGPWAKSGHRGRLDYKAQGRPHFRHELASALALLDGGSHLLEGVQEADLVVYLVGAHHGRVRLGIRSMPDEASVRTDPGQRVALGIWDGDALPAVEIPGGRVPACRLDLSVMDLGSTDERASWTGFALRLRDRGDLGPFRLALLEALLRLADWKASARENRGDAS